MIFFFCALAHSEINTFISLLEYYIDASGRYIVGLETANDSHFETSGQHFHVCADMDLKQYDKFRKTVFVNKYKLRGQSKKALPKQYGRTLKVKDPKRFMAYTLKDQNYRSKGVTVDELNELVKISFPRPQPWIDQVIEYMENNFDAEQELKYDDIDKLEVLVLEYHQLNDRVLCKSRLKAYVHHYIQLVYPFRKNSTNQRYILELIKNM